MVIDKYNKEAYDIINIPTEFSLHVEAFILSAVFLTINKTYIYNITDESCQC